MAKKATSRVAALEPLGGSASEPRRPYDESVAALPPVVEETVMVAELKPTPNFAKISVSLDADQREHLYQAALVRLRVSESAVIAAGLRLFLALSDAEQRKLCAGMGRRRTKK